ncbi:MAG: Gfo/Idh/MocA family protein [Stackebrandtia sp.]
MPDAIRWGILATGGIAAAFTEDLKTLPDAEVAAVCSRTPESARRFAERFDIPRAHGSWKELADDDAVDVVYVANTQNAHHEAAALMLESGKAVLCEKPFTLNLSQSESLVELARERDLFLMEAMWMRCNPAVLRMVDLVDSGAIGPVTNVSADFSLAEPVDVDNRLRDPRRGGGGLLDLGVYPVTLAHLFLGPPSTIAATGRLTPVGVDEVAGMVFGYESGAAAVLSCGIAADGPIVAAISGPGGRIELDAPFYAPSGFRLCRGARGKVDVQTFAHPYTGRGMVHEAVEVMRCMREGLLESPLVPWQSTLDVMTTLDEVRRQLGVRYPGESDG